MKKIDNLLDSILDIIEAAGNKVELVDATGTIYRWIREHRESTLQEQESQQGDCDFCKGSYVLADNSYWKKVLCPKCGSRHGDKYSYENNGTGREDY